MKSATEASGLARRLRAFGMAKEAREHRRHLAALAALEEMAHDGDALVLRRFASNEAEQEVVLGAAHACVTCTIGAGSRCGSSRGARMAQLDFFQLASEKIQRRARRAVGRGW